MPLRLPSVDEVVNSFKANPNTLLTGVVVGVTAGALVMYYVSTAGSQVGMARLELIKEQRNQCEGEIAKRNGTIVALSAELKELKNEADQQNKLSDTLSNREKELNGKIHDLISDLDRIQEQNNMLNKKNAQLSSSLEQLKKEYASGATSSLAQARIDKDKDRLTRQISELKKENISLQEKMRNYNKPKANVELTQEMKNILVYLFKYGGRSYELVARELGMETNRVRYFTDKLKPTGFLLETSSVLGDVLYLSASGRAYVVEQRLTE